MCNKGPYNMEERYNKVSVRLMDMRKACLATAGFQDRRGSQASETLAKLRS